MEQSHVLETDLETRAESAKDVTKIDFPAQLIEAEVYDLLKYIIVESSRQNPTIKVDLTLQQHVSIGESLQTVRYDGIQDVPLKTSVSRAGGTFVHVKPGHSFQSAQFSLRTAYNQLDLQVYTGIDFEVTPGYEPGQLHSDSVEIMKDVKDYVSKYFSLRDKI